MTKLNPDTESCPCQVCRSDMAYIYPCESPVIIQTVMEIAPVADLQDGASATTTPAHTKKGRQ